MRKINSKIHIFTDFDGTITKHDSLELILDHFTGTEWRKIEEQVTLGRLSEKTSLQAEFDLMNEKPEDVLNYIDENVQVDSTFKDFIDHCNNNKFNLTILSGGIDVIIERVLKKFKFHEIPYFCNSINISDISYKKNKKKWTVIPNSLPKIKNNCNHCKTYHLEQARKAGMKVIYIGDGNTDRCPAENADVIFAKDSLKKYLVKNSINHYSFNIFKDIQKKLEELCFN